MHLLFREIGPERRGRKTFLVVEVDIGIVGPSLAGGSGLGDLGTENQNVLAVDLGIRPDEAPVLPGNSEAAERVAPAGQST